MNGHSMTFPKNPGSSSENGTWNLKMVRFGSDSTPQSLSGNIPSRELTYPTLGKGTSSSRVPWDGIC